MNKLPSFRLGGQERNYLLVEVVTRTRPQDYDFWDGNRLNARISVQAGAFAGTFHAALRCDDFAPFLDSLRQVYQSLGTETPTYIAEFTTMEDQLSIEVLGDAFGHITAQCVAMDDLGTGNRLEFDLEFDQTFLPEILSELEAIITAFPVRGNSS